MIKHLTIALLFHTGLLTVLSGQQNNLLFFMHNIPESNFINPAVQNNCKLFIGLPVLSSVHFNYGNTGFSYDQLFIPEKGTDYYRADIDALTDKLAPLNFIINEMHTSILALGYRHEDYYFTFSLQEKNFLAASYTNDMINLAWNGNTPFEGDFASFEGSGLLFNHYREYALGISRQYSDRSFGIKAKLLFGKLNITTKKSDFTLFTENNTFDLFFNSDLHINTSLPLIIDTNENGFIDDPVLDESISWQQIAFNRQNPGIAFDAGFIYEYDNNITISGSILDLGFIRWRSNLNTLSREGEFYYSGPLGDTITIENYEELLIQLTNNFRLELSEETYFSFLPVRMYLGGTFKINEKINIGALYSNIIFPRKIISALTLSGNIEPVKGLHTSISYSYNNRTFNNLGLGIALGNYPVQFYALTDNLLGLIWPQKTRNINLRFGLNIILGCNQRTKTSGPGCYWLEQAEKKRKMKERLLNE